MLENKPEVIVPETDMQISLEQAEPLPLLSEPEGTEQVTASMPHQRPNLQTAYVPPRNETEEQIAAIWQKVLGIEKVGMQDNFFEVGGDSLMGIRIINQLRNVFEVGPSIPIHLFFTTTTIEGMAEAITQKQKELLEDKQEEERPSSC